MGAERCGACEAYDMRTGGARYARACKIYVTVNQIKFIMEKEINPMKNEKKMNNKGFSLVELIIVIAIMAVLIGVLAPQYMKYVERSRAATDRDNVVAIEGAIQTWYVDPSANSSFADGNSLTLTNTATTTVSGALLDAMNNAGLPNPLPQLTNRSTFSSVTITVHIDGNGNISVTDDLP